MIIENQLELVVHKKKTGLIVLEAKYDELSLHWNWLINGVPTGLLILRHEADSLIRNKEITAKIALKEMIKTIKERDYDGKPWGGVESKQIRHQPFASRFIIEQVKILAREVYPELVI